MFPADLGEAIIDYVSHGWKVEYRTPTEALLGKRRVGFKMRCRMTIDEAGRPVVRDVDGPYDPEALNDYLGKHLRTGWNLESRTATEAFVSKGGKALRIDARGNIQWQRPRAS